MHKGVKVFLALLVLAALSALLVKPKIKHVDVIPPSVAENFENNRQVLKYAENSKKHRFIVFSLYREHQASFVRKYGGLLHNIRLAREVFPDFSIRVYYDFAFDPVMDSIRELNVDAIPMNFDRSKGNLAHFWKFHSIEDETVELFIYRDLESRITPFDRVLTEEWMKSGKLFHSIRTSEMQTAIHPQWFGARYGLSNVLGDKELKHLKNTFGDDMLDGVIWPLISKDSLFHSNDRAWCQPQPVTCVDFPAVKSPFAIGATFDENQTFSCDLNNGFCTLIQRSWQDELVLPFQIKLA
jgi:hypothetical protein